LLVVALHTGRNLTPLLEMDTNCLRAHPKDNMVFLVCYKRRGNSRSQVPLKENSIESITTAFTSVAQLIRRVIELTATLRLEAPAHLQDRVWLFRAQGGKSYGNISALTSDNIYSTTQKLINDFNLQDGEGKSLRINVSRLRKTFTNRIYEILEEDQIAAAVAAGNTPQVLANHYLRPGENAQRNWKFMGVVLTQELLSSTIGATEKTPVGKCTDIKKGQFAPRKDGVTCMSFLDCVRCRNYVVTGDDLYRLFSFYWRIYAERSRMSGRKWDKHYRHIIRLIDRDVITLGINKKIFRQSDVDAARERGRIDPHPYWSNLDTLEVL
jgi:hypothetical protein